MTTISRFETFEAFLQQALVVPRRQDSSSSRASSWAAGDGPWHGTDTFKQAVELARRGWPEGAAKALELRAEVESAVRDLINARSTSYTFDVAGEFVDVGRYLSGEPECFGSESQDYGNQTKPVVKIVANLAASGAVSPQSLFVRGAAIIAAVDVLEALGRRVEVWVAKGSARVRGRDDGAHETHVLVKQADQPIDIDRLGFAIAHPACLRRLCFSIMEQHGHLPNNTYPHRVTVEGDAIVTDHSLRGSDFSKRELLELVARLCGQAGVEIPQSEIEAIL
jgi:hypothetical protein